ncbi:MAG: hypothetical protein Q8L48_39840 [Archangium sp.]|nr:hypothetical protein [Archangium sp.]
MTLLFPLSLLLAADCAACHEREAAALSGSRHAQARRLPVFEHSFAEAKSRWCLSCHRPEGEGDGLTCLTCHAVAASPGAVWSAAASDAGQGAHPVHVDRDVTRVCARCHEFAAPRPGTLSAVVSSKEPLQATVTEQRLAMPGASCVTCHEPHHARGGHEGETLRQGVAVTARDAGDGGVAFTVTVGRTGHRFPTGDPFRRLVVQTCRDPACAQVVARRVFQRTFGLTDAGTWAAVSDSTLPSGGAAAFTLAAGAGWSARYFYGDSRFERLLPPEEVFFEVASGSLAP